MDEDLLKVINLPELVKRAVATTELAPVFQESGLTVEEIAAQVALKLPDMLSVAGETVSQLHKADVELTTAEQAVKALGETRGEEPIRAWMVLYVAAGLSGAGLIVWSSRQVTLSREFLGLTLARIGLFAGLAMMLWALMGALVWWRKVKHYRRINKELSSFPVWSLRGQQSALQAQLRDAIYDKGVRAEVNGILSNATVRSYASELGEVTAAGLSEVFASAHEVETQARRDLNDLMRLPGGSIGLAGPRGAGKTTLMMLVANRAVKPDKRPCSVLCPAPVEYDGRDFLMTLFLLLCNWVLEDRQPQFKAEDAEDLSSGAPPSEWVLILLRMGRPLMRWLRPIGLLLLLSGLGMAYLTMPAASTPAAVGAAAGKTSAEKSPGGETAGAAAKTEPPASKAEKTVSSGSQNFAERYLKALGLEPMTLVEWGLWMQGLAWALFYLGHTLELRYDNRRDMQGPAGIRFSLDKTGSFSSEGKPDLIAEEARRHRDALRFQQSYTSGWSGALKLPFGLEGGMNGARTMSRSQRSLPELVSDFRGFLQTLASGQEYGRVTICIDELDKLESDDKAHLFLNQIKAIFGVPNVFYLVSVSENAISAFERRGLPFRDVFDSSFDTIVQVNYLTNEESKALLKRRTTRVPEPFLCLCHCMSGGLPRDLIRACRDMLSVSAEERRTDLLPLARSVIAQECHGKARAMSTACSKLSPDADQTQFLTMLMELLTGSLAEDKLLDGATTLLRSADELRELVAQIPPDNNPHIREQALQLFALAALQTEFGLYLGYVETVLEVFALFKQPDEWRAAENGAGPVSGADGFTQTTTTIFDRLAEVRQALSVSSSVGRQRLVAFRSAFKLDPTPFAIASATSKGVASPGVEPPRS